MQSVHGVSAGPAFFSPFLGKKGISHLVYLKAGVPRTVFATCLDSWAHRRKTGTVSKSRGTEGWTGSPSPCVQLSAGVAGNSYVNGAAGLPPPTPDPRATCPQLVHPSTGLRAGGGAEKDSIPHTGCFGDK